MERNVTRLALVGLNDDQTDLLSWIRQRDDVILDAVFHPDPQSLLVRLARLAHLPVAANMEALAEIPFGLCVGPGGAGEMADALRARRAALGREAPRFVGPDDLEAYLEDTEGFGPEIAEAAGAGEPATRGAAPDEAGDEGDLLMPIEDAAPPAAALGDEVIDSFAPAVDLDEVAVFTPGETPEEILAEEAESPGPAVDQPPAPEAAHPGESVTPAPPPAEHIGPPPPELSFEPTGLARWLAEEAVRLANGSAAVVWRRDPDGLRYSLLAYYPDAASLPTIPIPPAVLEELVRADRVAPADPARLTGEGAPPPPFRLLAVPLPGPEAPFGLLGLFRPGAGRPFDEKSFGELGRAAAILGPLLSHSAGVVAMERELRSLRIKDRLRDLLLSGRGDEGDFWLDLLRFLLEEVPADLVHFFRLGDDGRRLNLVASTGTREEAEGWLSLPVGRGILGTAFTRGRLTVLSADDPGMGEAYLLPVHAVRGAQRRGVGLLVMEGAPSRTGAGEETGAFLESVGRIAAPILALGVAEGQS